MGHAVTQPGILVVSYVLAGILFILSLGGLSNQESSRRGNWLGILGMTIAVVATFFDSRISQSGYGLLVAAVVVGGSIGAVVAARVAMTAMPQLVAGFHSFVGLAAVLVGVNSYLDSATLVGAERTVHLVEVFLGVLIGAITFTGSIVAFGKLQGLIRSKPLLLPGRHALNILMCLVMVAMGYLFFGVTGDRTILEAQGMRWLLIMTGVAFALGAHLVMSIGGADMPVVVSMLNSYSGWAAAATGFLLNNDLLIITGALVGSSGAILSYIMCTAMNRSLVNVIFGGFGANEGQVAAGGTAIEGEVVPITIEETVALLKDARRVIVIPGYGMAVARAQHPIKEISDRLRAQGVDMKFAIHPVAGRLPGHMNVLLAEADVPYDIVMEMDEINGEFPETDVALVIGANDIVNPGAQEDPSSPIYGMPVLETWKARTTIVLKRSMAAGYAGVENPLFYKENTRMLFGDAKKSVDSILAQIQ
jgi:H+-translocating NAD(P) transhydrogenase subunit beta